MTIVTADSPLLSRLERIARGGTAGRSFTPSVRSDNRRFAQRKHVDWSGLIAFGGRVGNVGCRVCDTSSTGALIEITNDERGKPVMADEIPERFTLGFVTYRDCTEVECMVMWRRGRRIGARYISSFRTSLRPVKPKHAAAKPTTRGKR
jgi:hypothetical protein